MRSGINKQLIGTRNDTFYLFNAHGDVTALTDKAGTVTKTYEYDTFGNELNPSSNDTNPFRYCGEYYDSETGSIYLRARYYSPATGRFTAEDPIRDGLNWYAYCDGNPVMFWNPLGLTKENNKKNLSSEQLKQLEKCETDYNIAKANNDYVGMNNAHRRANNIRLNYDPDVIRNDNYDYTHGGAIYEYSYISHDDNGRITGKVYILKYVPGTDSFANNQSINEDDYVCIDARDLENSNIIVMNVSEMPDATAEKIVDILLKFNEEHPNKGPGIWNRSIGKMINELKAHRAAYKYLPIFKSNSIDADLDNDDESSLAFSIYGLYKDNLSL